jgi:hypothetical protein
MNRVLLVMIFLSLAVSGNSQGPNATQAKILYDIYQLEVIKACGMLLNFEKFVLRCLCEQRKSCVVVKISMAAILRRLNRLRIADHNVLGAPSPWMQGVRSVVVRAA